ncbi:MAG: LysR family transcriptional regulator [Vulcanimicrobiaceae bacterium]
MLIRQLEYLVALAAEKHFARAAERCEIAQPTLSLALRQLEDELGVAIVERGNRFRGFTPEGEIVLGWSRRMLADADALRQELGASRGALAGRLRLGIIPSAIAAVAPVTAAFATLHPHVIIDQAESTSAEILRGLATYELDAAISYTENEPLGHVIAQPMYEERYVLVTPVDSPLGHRKTVEWRETVQVPLCLLRRDMQNRRIIDGIFARLGITPTVGIEASSMISQFCYLETGVWSCVMPESYSRWLEPLRHLHRATLVEPIVAHTVGLLVAEREPIPPLIAAFRAHVTERYLRETPASATGG